MSVEFDYFVGAVVKLASLSIPAIPGGAGTAPTGQRVKGKTPTDTYSQGTGAGKDTGALKRRLMFDRAIVRNADNAYIAGQNPRAASGDPRGLAGLRAATNIDRHLGQGASDAQRLATLRRTQSSNVQDFAQDFGDRGFGFAHDVVREIRRNPRRASGSLRRADLIQNLEDRNQ